MSVRGRRVPRGLRALVTTLDPAAASSPAEHLALTLRQAASATGTCACGAVGRLEPVAGREGRFAYIFDHARDCPGSDESLARFSWRPWTR